MLSCALLQQLQNAQLNPFTGVCCSIFITQEKIQRLCLHDHNFNINGALQNGAVYFLVLSDLIYELCHAITDTKLLSNLYC